MPVILTRLALIDKEQSPINKGDTFSINPLLSHLDDYNGKSNRVKKGSKLNFYKFIETEEPKGKGSNPFGATTHFNNNTTAINQIGESVNGLISMVAELKELELARLDQINKNKPTPEPEPKDDKKKKAGNPLVNFAKNASKKGGDFLSGILGMLGNMLKMFIAIPALMYLVDPANKEKLIHSNQSS